MSQDELRDLLPDYALGLLEDDGVVAVARYLRGSATARAEARLYLQAAEALALGAPPIPPLSADIVGRITAALEAHERGESIRRGVQPEATERDGEEGQQRVERPSAGAIGRLFRRGRAAAADGAESRPTVVLSDRKRAEEAAGGETAIEAAEPAGRPAIVLSPQKQGGPDGAGAGDGAPGPLATGGRPRITLSPQKQAMQRAAAEVALPVETPAAAPEDAASEAAPAEAEPPSRSEQFARSEHEVPPAAGARGRRRFQRQRSERGGRDLPPTTADGGGGDAVAAEVPGSEAGTAVRTEADDVGGLAEAVAAAAPAETSEPGAIGDGEGPGKVAGDEPTSETVAAAAMEPPPGEVRPEAGTAEEGGEPVAELAATAELDAAAGASVVAEKDEEATAPGTRAEVGGEVMAAPPAGRRWWPCGRQRHAEPEAEEEEAAQDEAEEDEEYEEYEDEPRRRGVLGRLFGRGRERSEDELEDQEEASPAVHLMAGTPAVPEQLALPTLAATGDAAEAPATESVALAEAPAVEPEPETVAAAEAPAVELEPEPVALAEAPTVEPETEPVAPTEAPTVEPEPEPVALAEAPTVEPETETVAATEAPAVEPEPEPVALAEAPAVEPEPETVALAEAPAVELEPEAAALAETLTAPGHAADGGRPRRRLGLLRRGHAVPGAGGDTGPNTEEDQETEEEEEQARPRRGLGLLRRGRAAPGADRDLDEGEEDGEFEEEEEEEKERPRRRRFGFRRGRQAAAAAVTVEPPPAPERAPVARLVPSTPEAPAALVTPEPSLPPSPTPTAMAIPAPAGPPPAAAANDGPSWIPGAAAAPPAPGMAPRAAVSAPPAAPTVAPEPAAAPLGDEDAEQLADAPRRRRFGLFRRGPKPGTADEDQEDDEEYEDEYDDDEWEDDDEGGSGAGWKLATVTLFLLSLALFAGVVFTFVSYHNAQVATDEARSQRDARALQYDFEVADPPKENGEAPFISGRLFVNADGKRSLLVLNSMPKNKAGENYRVWAEWADGTVHPYAVFFARGESPMYAELIDSPMKAKRLFITAEPVTPRDQGPPPAPTGPKYVISREVYVP